MNKYIVVTENSQEVVYADNVDLRENGILLFFRYKEESGNSIIIRVAAFKEYEYFLLDEENDDESFEGRLYGMPPNEPVNPTKEKQPWSIPQKDEYPPINKKLGYVRVFDHLNNGNPVKLMLENEQGVKSIEYCYLRGSGNNIDPNTGDNVMISVGFLTHSPLTWAYYDKDGNLEKAEIR